MEGVLRWHSIKKDYSRRQLQMVDFRPSQANPGASSRLGNQPGIPPDLTEVIRLVGMIYPLIADLDSKETAFVEDMKYKLKQFGTSAQVTWRQVYWLRDIKDRLMELGSL